MLYSKIDEKCTIYINDITVKSHTEIFILINFILKLICCNIVINQFLINKNKIQYAQKQLFQLNINAHFNYDSIFKEKFQN